MQRSLCYDVAASDMEQPMLGQILKDKDGGLEFSVHLTPGSKREGIVGIVADVLKIAVHAKPTDNQANNALIEFIATIFKVAKSKIMIKSGHKSRNKILFIKDFGMTSIPDTIHQYLDKIDRIQKPIL
ncbi:MAG: DUF167 domain-containing protein [Holosporales bacterium]|jgi:uncharacterized protein (TIGR00251 family)|nr:DUF167 domain-containing protein [Holosporales bacterium]